MLDILHEAESLMPEWMSKFDPDIWHSVLIDYHPPTVERIWRDWGDYRVFLHRIHPCNPGEALFHPHPWFSAVRIVSGTYEMAVGYGEGNFAPPIATTIRLTAGSEYEMVELNGWHSVRPISVPSLSLMVASKPNGREAPRSDKKLGELPNLQHSQLWYDMSVAYLDEHPH